MRRRLLPWPRRRTMSRSTAEPILHSGSDTEASEPSLDSSFEKKQPFPPLSADDRAPSPSTQGNNNKSSYPEDDQGIISSTYEPIDVENDADFQSHYSHEPLSDASSDFENQEEDEDDTIAMHHHHHQQQQQQQHPFRQSTSSLHGPNAFAPPFYNRPPTPLPPSPSLTSLLRPPFSATTSRPTTPDASDVDTPDDTEAAVAKSARRATTVPRASPKVPTYEYYGFVLYLASSLAFCKLTRWRVL